MFGSEKKLNRFTRFRCSTQFVSTQKLRSAKRLQHATWHALLILFSLCFLCDEALAQTSRLDRILEKGVIRIGTTGDFKPFTYLNPDSDAYEGMDIDAAQMLGAALGVSIRFVPATWSTLSDGILDDRYDIAMGGITRTLDRQMSVGLTLPYITVGKAPLVRKTDQDRFLSLESIDDPSVRIGVNPGGTNESFVRAHFSRAQIQVIEQNLDIPMAVAEGKVDVMITDNVEAVLYANADPRLHAMHPDQPYTRDDFGYMLERDDQAFANWLNLWIHRMHMDGSFDKLRSKWIGRL